MSGKQAKGRKRAQKPAPAEPDAEADNDDDAEIAPEQAPAAVVSPRQIRSLAAWVIDAIDDGDYATAATAIDELADAVRAARQR